MRSVANASTLANKLACDSGAAFGAPVVPEVKTIVAGSVGVTVGKDVSVVPRRPRQLSAAAGSLSRSRMIVSHDGAITWRRFASAAVLNARRHALISIIRFRS